MIAPTMVGSIFSWSLTNIKGVEGNEKPLGFPLNQYFPFFVLSLIAILNAVLCSRIPLSMDKSKSINQVKLNDEEEDDIGISPGNITNITVGYFTPNIDDDDL